MSSHTFRADRRRFLARGACAALGSSGMLAALDSLRLVHAATPPGSDYKALVCIFLLGGNDSYHMVVPTAEPEYSQYRAATDYLAQPRDALLPLGSLTDGRSYGAHPALLPLKPYYDGGKLGIVANVGTLVAPTTRQDLAMRRPGLPPHLFSHSNQQFQWQSIRADNLQNRGWVGRAADLLAIRNTNQSLSMNISLAGSNVWQLGDQVFPYHLGFTGARLLKGFQGQQGESRLAAFQAILDLDHKHVFQRAHAAIQRRAMANAGDIMSALDSVTPLQTEFPVGSEISNLAAQLRMVARMISTAGILGMQRQSFYCAMGGWDTHNNQETNHPLLLADLAASMAAFQSAMEELGLGDQVTTFTASDFGRTWLPNGKGTDHGWGGHQLVMGGAVQGGRIHGRMPELALDSPDDVGRGRWLPSASVDQYGATLARWFGVSDSDLHETVFPNLGNFDSADLGFMG